jgi:ketosteroid isomerase-like protein
VSEENVEIVRRQIGDVDLAAVLREDDAWATRMAEIETGFEANFEFVVRGPGEPVGGRGFEEWRGLFLDWIEPWETYRPGIEEIRDLGDRVVVLGCDRGRMKGMEREVEGPKGLVLYTLHGGKIARIEYFFDRGEGLKAAGLTDMA